MTRRFARRDGQQASLLVSSAALVLVVCVLSGCGGSATSPRQSLSDEWNAPYAWDDENTLNVLCNRPLTREYAYVCLYVTRSASGRTFDWQRTAELLSQPPLWESRDPGVISELVTLLGVRDKSPVVSAGHRIPTYHIYLFDRDMRRNMLFRVVLSQPTASHTVGLVKSTRRPSVVTNPNIVPWLQGILSTAGGSPPGAAPATGN